MFIRLYMLMAVLAVGVVCLNVQWPEMATADEQISNKEVPRELKQLLDEMLEVNSDVQSVGSKPEGTRMMEENEEPEHFRKREWSGALLSLIGIYFLIKVLLAGSGDRRHW